MTQAEIRLTGRGERLLIPCPYELWMQMKGSLCPISFLLYPATAVGTLDQLSLANIVRLPMGFSHELGTCWPGTNDNPWDDPGRTLLPSSIVMEWNAFHTCDLWTLAKMRVLGSSLEWPTLSWFGYGSIPISTIFSGMNIHLPIFTSYFDVHQGYKVLTHCHLGSITRMDILGVSPFPAGPSPPNCSTVLPQEWGGLWGWQAGPTHSFAEIWLGESSLRPDVFFCWAECSLAYLM